jgi:hypothetical protein
MNIFYLDRDPKISAQAMTDKHVVKMIVESAQLLSTAHHILDKEFAMRKIYKSTHANHPSAVWVRESLHHYRWLFDHFLHLCDEYTIRYKKRHKTDKELSELLSFLPQNIKDNGFTQPPQAMPPIYHNENSVYAYRQYYLSEKLHTNKDTERFARILYGTQ